MSRISGRLGFDASDSVLGAAATDGSAGVNERRTTQLWSLLVLEFWFGQCVDSDAAGEPLE